MDTYSQARAKSYKYENNDCTVIAVSLCAGVTYGRAHGAMRRQGRQPGKGAPLHCTVAAIESFGKTVRPLKKHAVTKCRTVRTLAKQAPKIAKTGTFLVRVQGHVLCLKNGVVQDWSQHSLKRITDIFRVE